MTNEQKRLIIEMKSQGIGYRRIAAAIQIPENTVKTFLRRNREAVPQVTVEEPDSEISCCPKCGKHIEQTAGRKTKRFCSTECRLQWWNSHPGLVSRKAFYNFTCIHCGKSFRSYGRASRKYCCRECYLKSVRKAVV